MSRRMSAVVIGRAGRCCSCAAPTAFAQVDRATLTGIVRDPSDAVHRQGAGQGHQPGDQRRRQRVDDHADGTYLVVNLAPGEYLVQVEAHGLPALRADRVRSRLGARSRLDMSLAVGSIGETVTVEGVTPLLSTENAVLGTVVDAQRGRQAAARHPQLGRPAGAGPRRAERSLHRAGRRHLVRPHRRRQRARQSQPAEQLPARRRRQQQLLDQRAGADDADFAAVGGCDRRVQGGDEPVRRRIRLVAGRRDHRQHQVRHQHHPRHRVRLLPQRLARLEQLLRQARQPAEADEQSEPVWRQPRRTDRAQSRVLLRRLRGARASSRACCAPAAS